MKRRKLPAAVACWVLLMLPAAGAAGQQYDLSYGYLAGDYGSRTASRLEELRFAVEWGSAARFRISLPGVRGEVSRTLLRTRLGDVPLDDALAARAAGERLPPGVLVDERRRESGVGDLRFDVAVPIGGGGARRFRLEAEAGVKAPTADHERRLGSGEWDGRVGLYGEYASWNATLFGGVGWNLLGEPEGVPLSDAADALLGVESEPTPRGLRFAAWAEGHGPVVEGGGSRLALAAGVATSGRHAWRLVVRKGVTSASEDYAVEVGFTLRPSTLRRSRR